MSAATAMGAGPPGGTPAADITISKGSAKRSFPFQGALGRNDLNGPIECVAKPTHLASLYRM